MPFRREARIRLANAGAAPRTAEISIGTDRRATVEANPLRFHAQYAEEASTTGFSDHVVLDARGEGHFVGLSLFDSGHNHGGGDTALVDAGTGQPLVLHGVCGEDYFSFAWHKTGAMHALAGAPVHEARYRFHLESPYPFRRSLLLTFGVSPGSVPAASPSGTRARHASRRAGSLRRPLQGAGPPAAHVHAPGHRRRAVVPGRGVPGEARALRGPVGRTSRPATASSTSPTTSATT